MARTCPHCGTELPAVADAFCPDCREDLSQTPEEVRETADRMYRAVMGDEQEAQARSAVYSLRFAAVAGALFVAAVASGEWDKIVLTVVVLVLCGVWVWNEFRQFRS